MINLFLLFIIIILLQSYMKLQNKHEQLKHEHGYMADHILDIYKQMCRLNKATKKAVASKAPAQRSKKPTTGNRKKNLK